MARPPKPWFWKRRSAWFVTIDGTRHFLAEDKDAAHTRFHQLMAEPKRRVVRSDSLAVIIDLQSRLSLCDQRAGCHTVHDCVSQPLLS